MGKILNLHLSEHLRYGLVTPDDMEGGKKKAESEEVHPPSKLSLPVHLNYPKKSLFLIVKAYREIIF